MRLAAVRKAVVAAACVATMVAVAACTRPNPDAVDVGDGGGAAAGSGGGGAGGGLADLSLHGAIDASCGDTANDPLNCGGCGVGCATPAHGQPACSNGTCDVACDPGYTKAGASCVPGGSGGGGGGGVGGGGGFGGGGGGGGGGGQCGMTGASCTMPADCCSNLCLSIVCL